jgi:hypothetical protein
VVDPRSSGDGGNLFEYHIFDKNALYDRAEYRILEATKFNRLIPHKIVVTFNIIKPRVENKVFTYLTMRLFIHFFKMTIGIL